MRRAAFVVAAVVGVGAAVAWVEAAPGPAPTGSGRSAPIDEPNGPFFADGGQFVIECGLAMSAAIDPIAAATHRHDFFGSTAVTADSTGASLLGSDTTCRQRTDTASYWTPSLLRADGAAVAPLGMTAYYRIAPGVDPVDVDPLPLGLAMVAGDGRGAAVAGWGCGRGGRASTAAPSCPPESPLSARITFPDCWDGERLDSTDHRSHLAYSGPDGCGGSHPVALPRVTLVVHYPVSGDSSGLRLSSGPLTTAHADLLNGWNEAALAREVASCLRRQVVCGIPESARLGR